MIGHRLNGQLGAPTGVGLSADGTTNDFYFSTPLDKSGNTDDLVIAADVKTADICLMGSKTSCSGGFDPMATPLPAALPLFATGLGAMGLFGWRRLRLFQRYSLPSSYAANSSPATCEAFLYPISAYILTSP
jgi:hypothetical protein